LVVGEVDGYDDGLGIVLPDGNVLHRNIDYSVCVVALAV
jgi:hypothetical protein